MVLCLLLLVAERYRCSALRITSEVARIDMQLTDQYINMQLTDQYINCEDGLRIPF